MHLYENRWHKSKHRWWTGKQHSGGGCKLPHRFTLPWRRCWINFLYSTRETSKYAYIQRRSSAVNSGHFCSRKNRNFIHRWFWRSRYTTDLHTPSSWYSFQYSWRTIYRRNVSGVSRVSGDSLAWEKTAKIAVDPLFQKKQSLTPGYISNTMMSNDYVREIPQSEIFPEQIESVRPGVNLYERSVLSFRKGPYNYDASATAISKGINCDGSLKIRRHAGEVSCVRLKRQISNRTILNSSSSGWWIRSLPPHRTMVQAEVIFQPRFNFGRYPERQSQEFWKRLTGTIKQLHNIDHYTGCLSERTNDLSTPFDNDADSRSAQDVVWDSLNNSNGQENFSCTSLTFRMPVRFTCAYQCANWPSTPDYSYFLSDKVINAQEPPLDCYKNWNGMEGNSITGTSSSSTLTMGTNLPDQEDINRDNNMNTTEDYFQYKSHWSQVHLLLVKNYITDEIDAPVQYATDIAERYVGSQFKIPIKSPDATVGSPELTNEFVRMFIELQHAGYLVVLQNLNYSAANGVVIRPF